MYDLLERSGLFLSIACNCPSAPLIPFMMAGKTNEESSDSPPDSLERSRRQRRRLSSNRESPEQSSSGSARPPVSHQARPLTHNRLHAPIPGSAVPRTLLPSLGTQSFIPRAHTYHRKLKGARSPPLQPAGRGPAGSWSTVTSAQGSTPQPWASVSSTVPPKDVGGPSQLPRDISRDTLTHPPHGLQSPVEQAKGFPQGLASAAKPAKSREPPSPGPGVALAGGPPRNPRPPSSPHGTSSAAGSCKAAEPSQPSRGPGLAAGSSNTTNKSSSPREEGSAFAPSISARTAASVAGPPKSEANPSLPRVGRLDIRPSDPAGRVWPDAESSGVTKDSSLPHKVGSTVEGSSSARAAAPVAGPSTVAGHGTASQSREPTIRIGIEMEFLLAARKSEQRRFEREEFVKELAAKYNSTVDSRHPRMQPNLMQPQEFHDFRSWSFVLDHSNLTSQEPCKLLYSNKNPRNYPTISWLTGFIRGT